MSLKFLRPLAQTRILFQRPLSLLFVHERPLAQIPARFQRSLSTFFVHEPPFSGAPRLVPTPLVFVSASKWDSNPRQGFTVMAKMYSEKGYTCLDTDLSLPDTVNSSNTIQHLESELKSVIRASFNPFPPVIFARGLATLITQAYISSNPASGLVLISPPSNESTSSHAIPEFNFEPKFPILIVDTPQGITKLQASNRLVKDDRVEKIIVDNVEGQDAFVKIEQWMDSIGI